MDKIIYDTAIVGLGPAGITALIYSTRSKMKTIAFEPGVIGGVVAITNKIENWPGEKSIKGIDLAKKFEEHVKQFDARIERKKVIDIEKQDKLFAIKTQDSIFYSKTVIISIGARYKPLAIKGEREFFGKGVSTCLTCDAPFYKGLTACLMGTAKKLENSIDVISKYAKKIILIVQDDQMPKIAETETQVEIYIGKKIVEVGGDKFVQFVVVEDKKNGEKQKIQTDGLFLLSNTKIPSLSFIEDLGIETDKNGFAKTNVNMQTNIPGLYVAGDITGVFPQIVVACSQGAIASNSAKRYLTKLNQ